MHEVEESKTDDPALQYFTYNTKYFHPKTIQIRKYKAMYLKNIMHRIYRAFPKLSNAVFRKRVARILHKNQAIYCFKIKLGNKEWIIRKTYNDYL